MKDRVFGAILIQYFYPVMEKYVYFFLIDASLKITIHLLTHSPQCRCLMYNFVKYIQGLWQNEKLL